MSAFTDAPHMTILIIVILENVTYTLLFPVCGKSVNSTHNAVFWFASCSWVGSRSHLKQTEPEFTFQTDQSWFVPHQRWNESSHRPTQTLLSGETLQGLIKTDRRAQE